MPPKGFGLGEAHEIIPIRHKAKPIEKWGRKATGLEIRSDRAPGFFWLF